MRILVLQESDWIAKGPHQGHHLVERMQARGHKVRIVDFEIRWADRQSASPLAQRRVFPDVHKVIEAGKVTVIRPAFLRLPVLDYASLLLTHAVEIRRQFRQFEPDVIVGFGILNAFLGILIARRHRVPFAHYVIDELYRLMPRRVLKGLSKLVEQADYHRADLVFSINEGLRDYTIAMGAPRKRAVLLRAGVDLERYLSANGSEVRQRYGFTTDDLVLFFMGWLYSFSGLTEVAEDIVTAPVGGTNVKLLVVGKGDLWEPLERISAADSSAHRLALVSWRPYAELPAYLAAADICLLPAHQVDLMQNIVPIKVYEYMAAGKPVIASRLPGLVREFGEGNGVVFIDDPHEAVPTARELAASGAIDSLGRKARSFVSGNDWSKVTDEFESRLNRLVRDARVARGPSADRPHN